MTTFALILLEIIPIINKVAIPEVTGIIKTGVNLNVSLSENLINLKYIYEMYVLNVVLKYLLYWCDKFDSRQIKKGRGMS